jgi:hypothetical protein
VAYYRVEIAYRTKRQAVCCGMVVQAFNDTEAEEQAMAKIVAPYPARKWAYTRIAEATPREVFAHTGKRVDY